MDDLRRWCRVTVVDHEGTVVAWRVLEGPGEPDLAVVDDVARLGLLATRLGGRIVIGDVSPRIRELFELAGLRVEVQGQAEFGKEPLGVQERQEEVHPGDLPR